jgi:hypothetical protein
MTCGTSVTTDMMTKPTTWSFNGSAFWDALSKSTVLTPAMGGTAGSAFYKTPILADSFTASFTFAIGGGNGADGMAFAFQKNGANAMGLGGGGFDVTGLDGYAVEFDAWNNNDGCGDTMPNHMAIDSLNPPCMGGSPKSLTVNNTLPFTLTNSGWHDCTVTFSKGVMSVTVDGKPVFTNFQIPNYVAESYYFGFGGATGGNFEEHQFKNFSLTFPTPRCL